MALDMQTIIVVIIVAACAGYMARRLYRTWFGKSEGCSGGCGCGADENPPKET
jgi:hypothetical protein